MITSLEDLQRKIAFLCPTSSFSVSEDEGKGLPKEDGDTKYCYMDKFIVGWNCSNSCKCPSMDEINAIDENKLSEATENQRKINRNISKAKDLSIVAIYNLEKKSRPDLTFSDYLDEIEKQQANLS